MRLFAAVVPRRVPDGKAVVVGSWDMTPVLFLFVQARYTFNAPLESAVAFTAAICLFSIIGKYGMR